MGLEFYSFTGTRINHTLSLLLTMAGIKNSVSEKDCTCVIHIETTKENFMEGWGLLLNQLPEVDTYIATLLETNPAILGFSKWGKNLPIEFQIDLLKQKYFDFNNTEKYISTVSIILGVVVTGTEI
jgi:ATP-dependent helicase Lhr and Lhr-like helicase